MTEPDLQKKTIHHSSSWCEKVSKSLFSKRSRLFVQNFETRREPKMFVRAAAPQAVSQMGPALQIALASTWKVDIYFKDYVDCVCKPGKRSTPTASAQTLCRAHGFVEVTERCRASRLYRVGKLQVHCYHPMHTDIRTPIRERKSLTPSSSKSYLAESRAKCRPLCTPHQPWSHLDFARRPYRYIVAGAKHHLYSIAKSLSWCRPARHDLLQRSHCEILYRQQEPVPIRA